MKFTKIVDVTDVVSSNNSPMPQFHSDTDGNQMFSYEDVDPTHNEDDEQDLIQHDIEVLLPESKEIMADWTCAEIKVDEITSDELDHDHKRAEMSPTGSTSSIESMDSFYKPEADQSEPFEHGVSARREARDY